MGDGLASPCGVWAGPQLRSLALRRKGSAGLTYEAVPRWRCIGLQRCGVVPSSSKIFDAVPLRCRVGPDRVRLARRLVSVDGLPHTARDMYGIVDVDSVIGRRSGVMAV